MSFFTETWALLLVLFALLLLYGIWPYNVFRKLGVPGPRPWPFIGTFIGCRNGLMDFDMKCHQKYGKYWGIFDGRQPILAILDPSTIKTILVKEFYTNFTNRRDIGLNGELDTSIITAPDDHWKRIRTVLSPTFTSGKLKEMMPIINHYGEILVKNIQQRVEDNEFIDTKVIFGAYSLDVVASTSFGIDMNSMSNLSDPFIMAIKKVVNVSFLHPLIILIVVFPFLAPLMEKLKVSMVSSSMLNILKSVVNKVKHDRQKNKHMERVDFLQLMLDSQQTGNVSDGTNSYKGMPIGSTETIHRMYVAQIDVGLKYDLPPIYLERWKQPYAFWDAYREAIAGVDLSNKVTLTDKEILTQAIIFIFAGYETTSTTLNFLSYSLAIHPDVQQKLQEEIDKIIPNQATPTYDAILQMEYLDMVVSETLRLYPLGGRIERVCRNTMEINGVMIPKGTVAMIPAFVLHRLPEYWQEPEEFRPERFSKENKETLDPYVFLPFGAGPRNCIGMRFALLTLKVAVVVLLQRFSFQTCKETPIPLELDSKGLLQPKKLIKLKLVPRNITGAEK